MSPRRLPSRGLAAVASALVIVAACSDDTITNPPAAEPTPSGLTLERLATVAGGGASASEISAFDSSSKRLFVVNGALGTVDVINLANPSAPAKVGTISVTSFGAAANSVAAYNGTVAVAVEAAVKTDAGRVAFYRASDLQLLSSVQVGSLPDMLTFSPNGRYVIVANEGEPSSTYAVDPEGSISIIDVSNVASPSARSASFSSFNGQESTLRSAGVRIYGPNATVAQDLEPEYVAVSDDSRTAWVTLQENNAIATVDIATAAVTSVKALGVKDHSKPGNALDASDRDSPTGTASVNIRTWPVFGMYQPDAVAAYTANGVQYLVTANEGDARDWAPGLVEEARVSSLTLNPTVFSDAACGGPCKDNARLGRLTVTRSHGLNAGTGQYDALYVFGARSFSIWNASTVAQVWDSGDQLEQQTKALTNVAFNASSSGNALDDRSDNKGPEPEGVALAKFGAKTFAFIALERVGGVMVYDITNPMAPSYVTYVNARTADTGDLGPEGVLVIRAAASPSGKPLLVLANEISGTTSVYQINLTY